MQIGVMLPDEYDVNIIVFDTNSSSNILFTITILLKLQQVTGKLLPIHANNKGKMILITQAPFYMFTFSADTDLVLYMQLFSDIVSHK